MTYPETPIDRAYDTIHTGLTGYYVDVLNIDPDEAALRAQNAIGNYADLLTQPQNTNTATEPEACDYPGVDAPCRLDKNHRPGHIVGPEEGPRCPITLANMPCIMRNPHAGPHISRNGTHWGSCLHSHPDATDLYPCILNADHTTNHRDQTGDTW